MNNEELLPVLQKQSKLPINIKNGIKKAGKITKYALLTSGLIITAAGTIAVAPMVALPAMVAAVYSGQKLLNNTVYKSYDDLAFLTQKSGKNTIKIFQDPTKLNMTNKIKDYSNIEKAGFMQLQAIVGMSKFNKMNKKSQINNFSTVSHGITRKTFKKLAKLGYIENYEEEYKKDSNLLLPKLLFGNFKALKDKVQMYDIKFNLTDKPLDLSDKNLQKVFPAVFGSKGVIQKYGYQIINDGEEPGFKIQYPEKNTIKTNDEIKQPNEQKDFKEGYKDSNLTFEKQAENAGKFNTNRDNKGNTTITKTREDKQH